MRVFASNSATESFNISFDGTTWLSLSESGRKSTSLEELLALMTVDTQRLRLKAEWTTHANRIAEPNPSLLRSAGPPYRRCRKILGIGLNYRAHADDLGANYPTSPASFFKGDHTIIGPSQPIVLPNSRQRVTSEAELGIIIGRPCYKIEESEALSYVAGICPILDQTAENILQENPRFLTRAKNFPTFFSFGPEIVSIDEVGNLQDLTVATYHNGSLVRKNTVRNMLFSPEFLIAFHSQIMPLFPGDIISTGTPGAVVINPGDSVECHIDGLAVLMNPVQSANE